MSQEANLYEQINNIRNSRMQLEQRHLGLREQLASAESQLSILRPRFERDKRLFENDLISEQEFEESRENFEFQRVRYELTYESYQKDSLQMELQSRQLDESEERLWQRMPGIQQILDNLIITAPIAGRLTTIELDQGQSISPSERIGQVDLLDGFKVRVRIDEFYLARIVEGLRGSFTFDGERHEVVISRVFPVIQEGQFQVDMDFVGDMPTGLRRGQTVRIRLELDTPASALLVRAGRVLSIHRRQLDLPVNG
jgi:HlyD family secretion protein